MQKPLQLADPSLLGETRFEKFCHWIPLLGWTVAFVIQCGRIGRAIDDVYRQLEGRTCFPVAEWGDDKQRLQRARDIGRVVKGSRNWPNDFFLPSDPWHLLVLEDEGMGEVEVTGELELQCGLTLDLDSLVGTTDDFLALAFSDIVDSAERQE